MDHQPLPSFEIDHVVLVVPDLEMAARQLLDETGLAAVDGGRHTKVGTANFIVPLGSEYLELLTVVNTDEAKTNPWGRWAIDRMETGPALHALALRTPDIAATAAFLGSEIGGIERTTPQGLLLQAELTGLDGALGDPPIPFFIRWAGPQANFPGRQSAPHRIEPKGIAGVDYRSDHPKLPAIAETTRGMKRATSPGRPGAEQCRIETANGYFVL